MALYLVDGDNFDFVQANNEDMTSQIVVNSEAYTVAGLKVMKNQVMAQVDIRSVERPVALDYTPAAGDTLMEGLPEAAFNDFTVPALSDGGNVCFVTVRKITYAAEGYPMNEEDLNMYAAPSTAASVVEVIPGEDTVEVLYRYNAAWLKVKHGSNEGFVDIDYIVPTQRRTTTYAFIGSMAGDRPAKVHFTYMTK